MNKKLKEILRPIYRRIVIGMLSNYRLRRLARQRPLKIVVGASMTSQPGWISTQMEFLNLLRPNNWKRYFSKNPIDAILAEHVWEHLSREEGVLAANICFQYLKPSGYLRVAVPDGFHPDPDYIEYVEPGGVGPGASDHKILYNYRTFNELFESAGFRVDLLEYFDENGQFHYKQWDPIDGMIRRSKRFDKRNSDRKFNYTSIILDARKLSSI